MCSEMWCTFIGLVDQGPIAVQGAIHNIAAQFHRAKSLWERDCVSEFSVCLTVEAKVLGEGLSAEHLKAHGDEVADGPGVLVQVA